MKDRIRYVLAIAAGVLAIPGLALASNAALSSAPDDTTTTTTIGVDQAALEAQDLLRACGAEGRYLVDLEATGMIDAVQQAALDALRPICEEVSLPLPVSPVATVPAAISAAPASPGTGTPSAATTSADPDFAAALAARERAIEAIERATDAGGDVDMINSAIDRVSAGDIAYDLGDYDDAEEQYVIAEGLALTAEATPQQTAYHDDDEDDDHEDDDHDEDEDDDHEDHEDEHDEDDD